VFTHFQQGTSVASFGAGISVGGGAAGAAGPITVTSPTTATANLTIGSGATLGLRTPITVTTGTESAPWSSPGFFVLGPVTGPFPTVTITSPTEGSTVTSLTTVTGSVVSPNLAYWNLSYEGSGSSTFTQFATGTTSTVSGMFDPTMLVNGIATIQLTGVDQSGQTSSTVVHVSVLGNVKVGNFRLAFNDLSIPVAGIPITVTRTYDSRVKSIGDFGFGWSLSYNTVQVQTSDVIGNNWYTNVTSGELGLPYYCVVPNQQYIVSVRLQDGTVYQFTPSATPATACALVQPPENVDLQFTPTGTTPANATLSQPNSAGLVVASPGGGATQLLDSDFSNVYGATGDPEIDGWTLTLGNGQVLQLSINFGLTSLTDTNGNTLSFTAAGITSTPSGRGVTYARDSENRINTITDPNGNVFSYGYDAAGDLTTFTDSLGNVSTFSYDGNHDLLSYTDPSGNQPIRSVYDDSGRLIQLVDAFGHVLNLQNDPGSSTETVTDFLGNTTTYVYDANGNIIQTTDALGNVSSATFDALNDKISVTNALGQKTTYTYDANKNQLTMTDPLGHTISKTYNAQSQVLTSTDQDGNVTTKTYDANENLLTMVDPLGNTRTNTYASNGTLLSTTDQAGKTTTYTYDGAGNLNSQTDANGVVTTYTNDANGNRLTQTITRTTSSGPQTLSTQYKYDGMNRITQTTYPDGSVRQTSYNAAGQKASITDGLGYVTAYKYNAAGRLIQTTYPDGSLEVTAYDADGHRTQFTGKSGAVTTYAYDALGRVVSVTNGLGGVTALSYDAASENVSVQDPRGNLTQYVYDAAGRRTSIKDALGDVTSFSFDPAGNTISMTDGDDHTTSTTYDGNHRVTQVTFADSSTRKTAYDGLGRITTETDNNGKPTQYAYDALSRLTSVTDAKGQITTYAYDEIGDRVSQIDGNGHTTKFGYDPVGRRTSRTLPLGQVETFVYDADGNMTSHTDFNGKTTRYTYDSLRRTLSQTPDASFGAPTISFAYDKSGNRLSMTDGSGTTNYQYDLLSELTNVASPNGSIAHTYDLAGNETSVATTGLSITYAYDALNRLSSVDEANTGLSTYQYDAVGNLTGVTYPNGVTHALTYNNRNVATGVAIDHAATPLLSYGYVVDPTGRKLSVGELNGRSVNYAYDNVYQLTGETVAGSVSGPNGAVTYAYDSAGNRTATTSTLAGITAGSLTYNANDQLSSTDTYDANGNTTASGGVSNSYDFANRLTQHGSATVVYDGDGNRVSKTVGGLTTKYLVNAHNPTGFAQILNETGSDGSSRSYVYGLHLISQRRFVPASSSFVASYYLYDGHFSTRALTDPTGAVTDTYDYDAFGNLIKSSGSTPNNYLYSGEQFDSDLGLYFNRARYLKTSTGRFWTMDPKPEDGRDPTTIHRYRYVAGDPVNGLDPSGLQDDLVELGVSEAIDETLETIAVPAEEGLVQALPDALGDLAEVEGEALTDAEAEIETETVAEETQGEWVAENTAGRSARSIAYQTQITGRTGQAFLLNGVEFDGSLGEALVEAKGPGYGFLLTQSFGDGVLEGLLDQAARQVAAAGAREITWYFAEESAATAFSEAIQQAGITTIRVLVQAAAAP
jgi:RHS repeat-associated protein